MRDLLASMAADSSKEHLEAPFDMPLETLDHQRRSVTDGRVSITGCRAFHQDAFASRATDRLAAP